jgi:HSF-type DNA-binding
MYGFHKINRTPRNQRPQADAQRWEFSHPKFLRGRTDLLEDIKRKTIEPDPNQARQRVELPTEVAAQLRRMSQEHKEVVDALLIEKRKVKKLVGVVKTLYDAIAHLTHGGCKSSPRPDSAVSHPLDFLVPAFPTDLLESPSSTTSSCPPTDDMLTPLDHSNPRPMKLTGNTLVPAGQSSASSSPTAPISPPDRPRPSRTTRVNAIAVEQQKVDADGHANKRTRLGVEMAAPGEGLIRRASTRSQTQPDGGRLSPPGTPGHAKRRSHTTHPHHSNSNSSGILRYMS